MWKSLFNGQLMLVKPDCEDEVTDDVNRLSNNQPFVEGDLRIDNGNCVIGYYEQRLNWKFYQRHWI